MGPEGATFATLILAVMISYIVLGMKYVRKIKQFKSRLIKKDQVIHKMIKALPILFVENYKDPDHTKPRDGSFVFHVVTRPEYDSKHIRIEWICEGKDKHRYDSLIYRYFKYLEHLNLEIHPILLGDRPYKGRIAIESYYEMDEDEIQTVEEIEKSVRPIS